MDINMTDYPRMDYRFEFARLQSYSNWPLPYMNPKKLASAGFFYTGKDDNVQCFECSVELSQWAEGDNPMSDHQRWHLNCRFVRNQPCGNVPIGFDRSTASSLPQRRDVRGSNGEFIFEEIRPKFFQFQNQLNSVAKLDSFRSALFKTEPFGPVYPWYANTDARLKTFESWSRFMPQAKEQMTDAGFFYTGNGDLTLCYYCGGCLKDWEPEDDPWTEHAKWFKNCRYVLMVKGQAFINSVTSQQIRVSSEQETLQMNSLSEIKKVKATASAEPEEKPNVELKAVCENADGARLCKICYDEELGVVFLPCRHMVTCTSCALSMKSCAICREPITTTVRAIIS